MFMVVTPTVMIMMIMMIMMTMIMIETKLSTVSGYLSLLLTLEPDKETPY